jgi:hypothetical protein
VEPFFFKNENKSFPNCLIKLGYFPLNKITDDGFVISTVRELGNSNVFNNQTNFYFAFNDIRRKTPGSTGNKKGLEVNLPESSRKFITCIRKYVLFYLKLLEETGDRSILERAYVSLRGDKRVNP